MSDRARGTLIGLAVGDALGAAVEFAPLGSFRPVTGYRSGGPHRLAPGEWTDDTSMAPVPIRFAHLYSGKLDELSRLAAESSLPTHASDQCVSGCRYLALVLAALIHGEDRDTVLAPDWEPLQQLIAFQPLHPLIHDIAADSFRHKQPPAIKGSGWVVLSLEASLWAFHDADSFEHAVLRAVNLGDDLAQRDMIEEALVGLLSKSDPFR